MRTLLRWFAAYRELEHSVQELSSQNLVLQDRLDQSIAERERVWNLAMEARKAETTALQMQVNIDLQRQGFAPLYEDAPKLPQAPHQAPENPVVPGRPLPSQAVRSQTQQFIKELSMRLSNQYTHTQ